MKEAPHHGTSQAEDFATRFVLRRTIPDSASNRPIMTSKTMPRMENLSHGAEKISCPVSTHSTAEKMYPTPTIRNKTYYKNIYNRHPYCN